MNKAEFLKDLGKSLHVLNQKERNDILSEYEQHIDFKVESGLSEEEAINNFGTINELSVEILDAYNVNLSYGKPTSPRIHIDTQKLHDGVDEFCEKIGGFFGSINKSIKEKWLAFIKKIKLYIKNTRAKWDKKSEQTKQVKQTEQAKPQTKSEEEDGSEKMQFYAFIKKSGDAFKNMMKTLWCATKWLFAFCLRAVAVVAILPILLLMLLLIIVMGFILILAFGGYPVIGIILMTMGVLMCSTTLVWLFIKYVFKKKVVQENG